MHGLFGQYEQEIAYGCPNQEVIRTVRAGNSLWLSECVAYSDRTSRNLPMNVRMVSKLTLNLTFKLTDDQNLLSNS
jgi:hypothetical protein